MASVVINDLEARVKASGGSMCLAYVYFRYSDAANITVRSVLEVLVKQIIEEHPDCARLAEEVYARHTRLCLRELIHMPILYRQVACALRFLHEDVKLTHRGVR